MTTGIKPPNSGSKKPGADSPQAGAKPAGAKAAPNPAAKPSAMSPSARSADREPAALVKPDALAKPAACWAMLANPKFLAAFAAVALAANLAAFCFLRLGSSASKSTKRNLELVLGAFEYNRVNPHDKQMKHGEIVVTLHLATKLDTAKYRQIQDRQTDLQAAVEEAMRRMRASDLADPRFVRLKNRVLEQLNEELGFDGIEEVSISNMPEPASNQAPPDQQATDSQAGDQPSAADGANSPPADQQTGDQSASAGTPATAESPAAPSAN